MVAKTQAKLVAFWDDQEIKTSEIYSAAYEVKQQMLSDAQQNNNKVIVTYDVETGQKEVVHRRSNSQSLSFNSVEVIARDTESQNVDLKKDCLDIAEKQGWEQSNDSIFRVTLLRSMKP